MSDIAIIEQTEIFEQELQTDVVATTVVKKRNAGASSIVKIWPSASRNYQISDENSLDIHDSREDEQTTLRMVSSSSTSPHHFTLKANSAA